MAYVLTQFANQPLTTVTTGGTGAPASGTSEQWTVASSTPFPSASLSAIPSTGFSVADTVATSEIIAVTAVTGTVWGVTRGSEGTIPVTHSAGFSIMQVVTADDFTGFGQLTLAGATAATGFSNSSAANTVGSYTVPTLNAPAPGVVYDINCYGFLTQAATTRVLTVALNWGSTVIVSAVSGTDGSAMPATALTRNGVWIEGRATCINSTTLTAALNLQTYNGGTPLSIANASTTGTTVTGATGPLALTITWSTAATTYAFTAVSSFIHRIS